MITVDKSVFTIGEFESPRGLVSEQSVDLAAYQGQVVRIYLDNELNLQVNPDRDMYWQLAEMYLSTETDEDGKVIPLDLEEINCVLFDLPIGGE